MSFYRSSHSVYDCRYHLVWVVKYRKRALIREHEREACEKVLRRAAQEYGMEILAIEVDVDHVHAYVQIPPQRSVGRAVGILKSVSARFMFQHFPYLKQKLWAGELWGASYFARTVGDGVTAEMVKRYIEQHADKAIGAAQAELFPKAPRPKGKTGARRP